MFKKAIVLLNTVLKIVKVNGNSGSNVRTIVFLRMKKFQQSDDTTLFIHLKNTVEVIVPINIMIIKKVIVLLTIVLSIVKVNGVDGLDVPMSVEKTKYQHAHIM